MYNDRMSHVAVLGAAGKMGSGITLLCALELADLSLSTENKSQNFRLTAFDLFPEGPEGLKKYLFKQAARKASKQLDKLRKLRPDWADMDEEKLGEAYAKHLLSHLVTTSSLGDVKGANLVFEAVSENPELKIKLFKEIEAGSAQNAWYLTNTSSVPIHVLENGANIPGRILGFHFYNPPAVQRLVELILTANTIPDLKQFAVLLASRMSKVIVPSHDFAGFIGNGHFMRDALHGLTEAQNLSKQMPLHQAIFTMNVVSKEFLVRPMGIFQLMDYVGIDVVKYILGVMDPYFPNEKLHHDILDEMVKKGIKGGQHADGSQKEGFFQYDAGEPVGVLDVGSGAYVPVHDIKAEVDAFVGPLPSSYAGWKQLIKDPEKEARLEIYFKDLLSQQTNGAALAYAYLLRSKEIGMNLVRDGIALSEKDVNTVLLTGFFHAYGPINDYVTSGW